jgi:catechol 2,3-dioxygenase-like lactoylglutathione lyase family enzyme
MKLHEIELFTANPKASREFYQKVVGLKLDAGPSREGLNIFDAGLPGVDFNTSAHNPGKVAVSFVVDDLAPIIARFRAQRIDFTPPEKDHTGMPTISVGDPDGNIVVLHGKKPLAELD